MLRQGADFWLAFSKSPEDEGQSLDAASVPLSSFAPCTRDILGHRRLRVRGPLNTLGPSPSSGAEGNARALWSCSL